MSLELQTRPLRPFHPHRGLHTPHRLSYDPRVVSGPRYKARHKTRFTTATTICAPTSSPYFPVIRTLPTHLSTSPDHVPPPHFPCAPSQSRRNARPAAAPPTPSLRALSRVFLPRRRRCLSCLCRGAANRASQPGLCSAVRSVLQGWREWGRTLTGKAAARLDARGGMRVGLVRRMRLLEWRLRRRALCRGLKMGKDSLVVEVRICTAIRTRSRSPAVKYGVSYRHNEMSSRAR